jgi:hypothetical protein
MNNERFGMLMSALDNFAQKFSKMGIENFELDQQRYTIKKVGDYVFIANSSKKHKTKKVNREMEKLIERFFEIYNKDLLEEFNGDLTPLQQCEECFREEIQESLEEPVKDFWEGIINR